MVTNIGQKRFERSQNAKIEPTSIPLDKSQATSNTSFSQLVTRLVRREIDSDGIDAASNTNNRSNQSRNKIPRGGAAR